MDNQLPLTPMPVLFRPQRAVEETDYVLKLSITMQSNGSLDFFTYPFIGVQVSATISCLVSRCLCVPLSFTSDISFDCFPFSHN